MNPRQQSIHNSIQRFLALNCSEYMDPSAYPQFLSLMDNLTVTQIEELFKSTKLPFIITLDSGEEEKFSGLKKWLEANEGFLNDAQVGLMQDLNLIEGEIALLLSKLRLAINDIQMVMNNVFSEIEQNYSVTPQKLNETKEKFVLKLTKATQEKIKIMKLAELRAEFYDSSFDSGKVKAMALKALGIEASA